MIKIGDSKLRTSIEDCEAQSPNPDFEAQVLIDFLRRLPSLSDLEWQTSTSLAPALLEFLRDQRPSCNLHLKPCHIPYDAVPYYIRAVLCLPNLRTLWLERKQDGAVQDLIQHVLHAPDGNLRDLRILWSYTEASPFGEEGPMVWNPELATHDDQRLGELHSLQLSGIQGAEGPSLQTWARHTDFGQLRTLSLEMPVTRATLEILVSLPLKSLRSLGLVLDPRDTSDQYSAALQTFICSLPSLSHLRLTGALPPLALKAILEHPDSTLHTLYLIPSGKHPGRFVFGSSTIALVTDSCTHVQDLGISIRRAWNTPGKDIVILKAIGRMPHLSSLDLTFDASDHTLLHSNHVSESTDLAPSDPSFSAFDAEPFPSGFGTGEKLRKGHVRDALINSAVDAELAKAVFNTILSATPDGQTPSLKQLSLRAASGGNFGTVSYNYSITEIVEEVGREWIVERSGREDGLEVRRAEAAGEETELSDSLGWDVEPIFRRIWPGEGDWFKEWRAFPLV